MKRYTWWAALFIFASSFCYAQNVSRFILNNGLTVLVKQDKRAPVATVMVWYDVGSADEPGGITGISHALEHMMFKGTPRYPRGVFSKTIASLGGQMNAFTSEDYTAYFESIPITHISTSFQLESDRMQNLLLDAQEFSREIHVVQEERLMRTDNNPQALTLEAYMATAHVADPYHHPVVGWMSDLQHMQVGDIRNWYHQFYAPNNAILVVVGDVDPKDILALAKRYFGPIQRRDPVIRHVQEEPPSRGKKNIIVRAPAELPIVILGYIAPTAVSMPKAIDPYVLEVIGAILDGGDSGRFTKDLIRRQAIASNLGAYYDLYMRYQTQFVVYGSPGQGRVVLDVERALRGEIEKLKDIKVPDDELERAKQQLLAEKIFEKDSMFGQAMALGVYEILGLGPDQLEQYRMHIQAVTSEDIQRVAKLYFTDNTLTRAKLVPTAKG